jgi:Zn-dependent peptidase ImmA (M78 family)
MIDKLKKKVDALYERVQEILDMRKRIKKVTINIFQNKKQLRAAYQEIYKKPCKLRCWYIYEYNAIYINANDLHEGMLAHEMAHSIIDHYLTVRPPRATAEILARYVDSHLFE